MGLFNIHNLLDNHVLNSDWGFAGAQLQPGQHHVMTKGDDMGKFKEFLNEQKKNCVPYGSDVSAGTYQCADCGYKYSNQSKSSLPPCPDRNKVPHPKKCWKILSGKGDASEDPYPIKKS